MALAFCSSIAFTSASSLACSSSERDWSNKVGSRTFGSNGRFFSLIQREVLLAHLVEELLPEPGHHGTEVVDDLLHLFLLRQELFIRRLHLGPLCTQRLHLAGQAGKFFTKSLYFEALVRHLFLSSPDTKIWPPSDFCKGFCYCKSRLFYLSKVKIYSALDSNFIRLT